MVNRHRGPSAGANEAPQHRALATESRVAILRLIQSADGALTAAEVVERIGLHPSTVRAHLEQLVDAQLLVRSRASDGAPGRPAWRYRPAGPEPAPGPYRALARALVDHLATGGQRAATLAGQQWGRRLAAAAGGTQGPAATAMDVLQGLGFDPRQQPGPAADETRIHLRSCPFLDLVGEQPDVMCALHAGMVRGIVQASAAPRAHAVLEPFAAPDACVLQLRPPRARATRARS